MLQVLQAVPFAAVSNTTLLIIIVLFILLFGGFRDWGGGPFYGTGYRGGGAIGLVLFILVILLLLGKI